MHQDTEPTGTNAERVEVELADSRIWAKEMVSAKGAASD